TVNGVVFAPFALPSETSPGVPVTVGSVSISESPAFLYGFYTFGSGTAPFANLSSSYKNLLNLGATAGEPATITLKLGGLTPGQAYDFQWWSNNSTQYDNWSQTTATAGNSVALIANTSGSAGGLGPGVEGGIGQYAIGRFTAAGTTLSITFNGDVGTSYSPLINALQVRAVPEPSTFAMALAAMACGGFTMWQRRKRA
ncbi:MAG: PEP-CTERM sorting domain-containing protein, partial [Planctomycetia bacterium]